jgi:transposase
MARRTKLEPHLSEEELKQRYRCADDPAERSHFHLLWLISQGKTQAEVAKIVGYSERWVQEVVKRYNARGPGAMRDRRHEHPGAPRVLNAEGESALEAALGKRPADLGIWTSRKVAAWASEHLGRRVSTTSGWRMLRRAGHTPKRPRPRHKRSDPEAQEAFKEAPPAATGRSTGRASGRGGGALGHG